MKREEKKLQKIYLDEWAQLKPEFIDQSAVLNECIRKLPGSRETEEGSSLGNDDLEVIEVVTAKRGHPFRMAAVAAACLVLLLILFNAAVPELAEQIPVLGNFFRMINHQRGENEVLLPPETSKAPESSEMVESSEVSVDPQQTESEVQDTRAEYEKKYMFRTTRNIALEKPIYLPSPYAEKLSFWIEDPEGNRLTEPCEAYDREERERRETIAKEAWNEYNQKSQDRFLVQAHCPMPESSVYEGREVVLRLTVSLSYLTEAGEPCTVEREYSMPVKWTQGAEENGVILRPIAYSSQGDNKIGASIHITDEQGYEDGNGDYFLKVRSKFDGSTYWSSAGGYDINTESKTIAVMAYERLPDYQLGKVLAEFTVDLETGEASVTHDHRDPESPLFWDRELWEQEDWAYPYYRAEDWELEELYDGYKVEYVCAGYGVGGEALNSGVVTVVTDRDYRDLSFRVEAGSYVENGWGCYPPHSQTTEEDTYGFCPLPEFSPQRYLEKDSERNYYMGVEERTLERDDLNVMFFSFGFPMEKMQRFGLQEGDTMNVTILDKVTKEVLHEETVTLHLPEDFPLPEGCHLGKVCGPGFPYVAVPDDYSPKD